MPKPRHWVRIRDMLGAIEGIRDATQHMTIEDYRRNWLLQRAVERGVEIISEASRHLPDDRVARYPAIPWPDIKSIGNHLRHAYGATDPAIMWDIVMQDLGPLDQVLRAMLAEIEGPDGAPPTAPAPAR